MPTLANAMNPKFNGSRAYTHKWEGIVPSQNGEEAADTGYNVEALRTIGQKSVEVPADFEVHQRL